MGKINKGIKCSVVGCENLAVRSLSREKLSGIKLNDMRFKDDRASRVYLCEHHYKIVKKKMKKIKRLDKMRYSLFK